MSSILANALRDIKLNYIYSKDVDLKKRLNDFLKSHGNGRDIQDLDISLSLILNFIERWGIPEILTGGIIAVSKEHYDTLCEQANKLEEIIIEKKQCIKRLQFLSVKIQSSISSLISISEILDNEI
jgi:hypothetical protein